MFQFSIMVLLLMILLWLIEARFNEYTTSLVVDYFSYKQTRIVTIFACSIQDSLALNKALLSAGKFWITTIAPEEGGSLTQRNKMESDTLAVYYTAHGVFIDYDCSENKDTFRKMSDRFLLNASFNWLIWSKDPAPSDLETCNLNIDSEVTWATPEMSTIKLFDLYKVNYTRPLISKSSGIWEKTNGLDYHLNDFKYLRRNDLQGLKFNAAAAVTSIPEGSIEAYLTSTTDRYADSNAKYNYALIRQLATTFNFTLQLYVTNSDGYPDTNGQFDGMMGMLQRGEAHLGINSLIMGPHRLGAVDFTGPTWKFRVAAIFRHPLTVGKSDSLVRPFSEKAWAAIILSWVIMAIALQFVKWLEAKRQHLSKQNMDYAWSASLLAVSGAATEQGTELESKMVSWRIAYLATLVQTTLVNAYYGACLVSDLLQPPPKNILTMRDLIKSKLQVAYVDNRFNRELFQEISDPIVLELYQKKMKSDSSAALPFDIAIDKLHKQEYAIHDEAIALYPIIEDTFNNDDKCAIAEIAFFQPMMTYNVIQKGSPYQKLLTYGFRKMMEDGIMARELSTWCSDPPKCQPLDKFYPVKTETVNAALALFAGGVFAAFVFICLERFQNFRCGKKKAA